MEIRNLGLIAIPFAIALMLTDQQSASAQCSRVENFRLGASDGAEYDLLGDSVAFEPGWIAAGSSANGDDGAVYLFEEGVFFTEHKIDPPFIGESGYFGYAIDIEDGWLAVGEPYADAYAGRVHIYRLIDGTWQLTQTLSNDDDTTLFGKSLTLSGDHLVVGAPGISGDRGRIYIYKRDGTDTWTYQRKLFPFDGHADDHFGFAVDLAQDQLAVGAHGFNDAAGAVFMYEGSGLGWTMIEKLEPAGIAPEDVYGYAVATDGVRVAIGAPYSDPVETGAGRIWIHQRVGDAWPVETTLTASDPSPSASLGSTLDLKGDMLVAGAPLYSGDFTFQGTSYIYRLRSNFWIEETKLLSSDAELSGFMGASVALDANRILVGGSFQDFGAAESGAIYMYEFGDFTHTLEPKNAFPGDTIEMGACGGLPQGPAAWFSLSVEGVPVVVPLALGTLDDDGYWHLQAPYAGLGLGSLEIETVVFTLGEVGVWMSNTATIVLN